MAPAAVSVGQFLRLALSFSVCLLSIHRTGRDDQPLSSTHISNGGSIHRTGISTPSSQFRRQSDTMDLVASLAGVQWLARQLVCCSDNGPPRCIGATSTSPGARICLLIVFAVFFEGSHGLFEFYSSTQRVAGIRKGKKRKKKGKCVTGGFGRITSPECDYCHLRPLYEGISRRIRYWELLHNAR